MSNLIYYFSGTGNSQSVAKEIASSMVKTTVKAIVEIDSIEAISTYKTIGIIFPVYMYRPPKIVVHFLNELKNKINSNQYIYILACHGGDPGITLKISSKILGKNKVNSVFQLRMPENYLPYWNNKTLKKNEIALNNSSNKIQYIVNMINNRENISEHKRNMIKQYFIPGLLYKIGYKYIPFLDKDFHTDDKCNSCGLCEKICPVNNIIIKNTELGKRPEWQNHCEQCFACINFCPQAAIQYGKKTDKVGRYHHPKIKASNLNKSF